MKRVAITGAGTVNALACDVPGTLAAFRAGRTAIGPLSVAGIEDLRVRVAAQIQGFRPEEHFEKAEIGRLDRFAQLAAVAAREALLDSALPTSTEFRRATGVIIGTAGGGLTTSDDVARRLYAEGRERTNPLAVPMLMHNAAASRISMEGGFGGAVFSVSSACASSNHAMGLAFQMVRSGTCPAVITGGSDAMLTYAGMKAWEGLRVMAPDMCRPFSATRNGMVQGEGAAVFVFEDMDRARARGARVLAEVVGFGMTSDAEDIVRPSQVGAERAMRAALLDAGLVPDDVGYINAHGTGTKLNDSTEAAAIRSVFGVPPPVSSTKAMHGHLMGATGAVELLAVILALQEGFITPTVGFETADPDCLLDVVPNQGRQSEVEVALSNAFAFGGLNAVLVLKKAQEMLRKTPPGSRTALR